MKKNILIALLMAGAVSFATAQGPAGKSSLPEDPSVSHWSAGLNLGGGYFSNDGLEAAVNANIGYDINPLIGVGVEGMYSIPSGIINAFGYGSLNLSNLCSPFRTGFWKKTNVYGLAGGGLNRNNGTNMLIMAGLMGEYNLSDALSLNLGGKAFMSDGKGLLANAGLTYKFCASTKKHARNIAMSTFRPQPAQIITKQTIWADCCSDAEKRLAALDKSNNALAANLKTTEGKLNDYKDMLAAQAAAKAATKSVKTPTPTPTPVVEPSAPVVAPPVPPIAKPVPQLKKANVVTGTMNPVEFETGSSILTADSKLILDEMAAILLTKDWKSMLIIGNSDNVGNATTNKALSLKRANIVKTYLVSKGLSADKLFTRGDGPINPIDTNKTAMGRRLNRRVDFEVTNPEAAVAPATTPAK
jgi:outer membrane protein OmpA-like peptidoglycan-associated protein